MIFNIELTDEEVAAMATICGDTYEWIENAAKERARIAIEDVVKVAMQKSLETQTALPTQRAEIVSLALNNGWVQRLQDVSTAFVPGSVTMRQARLALLQAGLMEQIAEAINALPSPAKESALIEWEYSNEVLRHNGFVSQLGPILGLSDAQLDDLFINAAKL